MVSDEDIAKMKKDMLHAAQVQDGLIPADSPDDFTVPQPLDANGLPWWFGPDYTPTPEALAPLGPEADGDGPSAGSLRARPDRPREATLVTRESIEAQFGYRISPLLMPTPIQSPKRIWTDEQMDHIRVGFMAQEMEEKWHGFMEDDRFYIVRSWTGFGNREATFLKVPGGWVIAGALVETDLDRYRRLTDGYEGAQLELLILSLVPGASDEKLEKRLDAEWTRDFKGPRLVISKAKGKPVPITKPGYSVKHGKLSDQHPLQREAYDEFYAQGFNLATKYLTNGVWSAQDVWRSATRYEKQALEAFGIESSRNAGLAKGAKVAAYEYEQSHKISPDGQGALDLS